MRFKVHINCSAIFRTFVLFLPLLICCSSSSAQQMISGVIKSPDNLPVAGATISVKDSKLNAVSDTEGKFSISAKAGDVLLFSSVGMVSRAVPVLDEELLVVTLSYTIYSLKEVLVTGYGTSQRKDITGAVAKLSKDDFNKGIITDPLQQLQGKVAGVVISQAGGDPNGELTVRIRGATSVEGQPPLLVIDGVAIDDFYKSVSTLNPADIESFDILKDASAAAIYGSRGANGVIIVTTKRGRAGKTSVEYNGFVGMERISNQLPVLNADQWRKATTSMNADWLDKGANTDWQKEITQNAFTQSHLVAISGGSDQLNFRGSIGYTNQQGVIINSGKEAISGRITVNQKSFKNKLEVRYGMNVSATKRNFTPDQSSTSQSRTSGNAIFHYTARFFLPVWPVYNPDGSYYVPNINIGSPVFALKEVYSKQTENFLQISGRADYEIIKGLKFGLLGAMSRGNDIYDRFVPPHSRI